MEKIKKIINYVIKTKRIHNNDSFDCPYFKK